MVKVKPLSVISQNYANSGAKAATSYKSGVETAESWQAGAVKGSQNWKDAMTAAIAADRQTKGIQASSDSEWKQASLTKGTARIGQGIAQAAPKQAQGYAPYHNTLSSLTLPDRTLDGMQNLTNRAGAVVQALMNQKKAIKG